MGVEYRHFIVVNDTEWKSQNDTFARVDAVLKQWSLVERLEKVVDLRLALEISLADSSPALDLAFVYAGVSGNVVERIAGPSAYKDVTDSDRYTMNTTLVIGNNYHVQWSSDAIYFELLSPPTVNGTAIEGIRDEFFGTLFDTSFSSDGATTLPIVKVHIADHSMQSIAWKNCLGYWRAAVVIDFGKDLPSFSEEIHALPLRDFVADIGAALRAPVLEIGEFY
ncbi:MAG: hypothetical protein HY253_12655 [Burkholderiales bacterium]|nr:hypothetical protein [Burkholderiales bacterium]